MLSCQVFWLGGRLTVAYRGRIKSPHYRWCRRMDSNQLSPDYKSGASPVMLRRHFGAGEENRTPIISLEG